MRFRPIPGLAFLAAAALVAAPALPAPAPAATEAAAPAAPEAPAVARPPMWRVSDADSEIYLLGSFHILPPGLEWRSDAVNAALDAAGVVWFEAELDTPAAKQKTLQILMTEGFNSDGAHLTAVLDPADAERLRGIAADLGLSMRAIEPMRPWQAFLTLGVQFVVGRGFDPGSGVETQLLRETRARGRDLHFFETVEQQLGFFVSLPPKVEQDLLATTLRDWDQQTRDFDDLFIAWASGDAAAIDAMMNERLRAGAPEAYEVLVRKRNVAWAKAIGEEMAGSGTELVVVGAGHLVGANSLPSLLEAAGFSVERIGEDASAGQESVETPL